MKHGLKKFLVELIHYSGQFAFFYILMGFIGELNNIDLWVSWLDMAILLAIQSLALSLIGHKPLFRFLFTLIVPILYTVLAYTRGQTGFDVIELFVWFVSLYMGSFQALGLAAHSPRIKSVSELFLCFGTAITFMFTCFLLYIFLSFPEGFIRVPRRIIFSNTQQIETFFLHFSNFARDPFNLFVILSGVGFSVFIAKWKIRIIRIVNRTQLLFDERPESEAKATASETQERRPTEAKEMAVLFADIRNFSGLLEKRLPQEVSETLNLFFASWEHIAEENGGRVNKIIGDTAVIVFEPSPDLDPCEAAASAGLVFLDRFKALQDELSARNLPIIRAVGIGLDFGPVVYGDIGSPKLKTRMALGGAVNVASRVEGLCKEYKQDMIITDAVFRCLSIEEQAKFSSLGEILIRGNTDAVTVYGKK